MTPAASSLNSTRHAWRVALSLIWIDIKQGLRKHLAARGWRDRTLKVLGVLFGLTFLAVLHLAAFSLLAYTSVSNEANDPNRIDLFRGLNISVWLFLLFVMISGGLVRAIVVLHEQDDSDLLLSSPVSPRAILASRLFGNALQSCLVDGFIIVPWINLRTYLFGPRALLGYVAWLALAVIVTCLDGLFSFGLIRLFGLRRARFLSQAVPFILIFGVTFFTGSMSLSVVGMTQGQTKMPPEMQAHFIALARSPLIIFGRSTVGNPPYLIGLIGITVVLSFLTLRLTERAFIEGTQNLAENVAPVASGQAEGPFHANPFWLEMRKSLRLVARTPMILLQCFAQALTPIAIASILVRQDVGRAVAFFVIFAVGVLSGILTIAAGTVEECDDLLRMSPRGVRLFRFGKIAAGCAIPLAVAVLTSLGLLLFSEPILAAGVLLAGIPLGLASSIIGETFATAVKPGTKPKLLSDPIMMIPLLGMQITGGVVAGAVMFASIFSMGFLALALIGSYLICVLAIALAQLRKPLFT